MASAADPLSATRPPFRIQPISTLPGFVAPGLTIADVTIVTKAPDFTGFTLEQLGDSITPLDGFDVIFEEVITDLPAGGAVWQDIDLVYRDLLPPLANITTDQDPELLHAIASVAAALAHAWLEVAGVGGAQIPGAEGPPSQAAGTLTASQIPSTSGLSYADIESDVTKQVLASLPRTTGGTPTSGDTSEITRPPVNTKTSGGLGPLGASVYGAAGLISVDGNGNVAWKTSPTANQPIEIWVVNNNPSPQLFASGPSGNQPAPWLFNATGPATFSLYANGELQDAVTVNMVRLTP